MSNLWKAYREYMYSDTYHNNNQLVWWHPMSDYMIKLELKRRGLSIYLPPDLENRDNRIEQINKVIEEY